MIAGKYYRCILKERPISWNSKGLMDFMLDGKPRKYLPQDTFDFSKEEKIISFYKKHNEPFLREWRWGSRNFEEVKIDPEKENQFLFDFS